MHLRIVRTSFGSTNLRLPKVRYPEFIQYTLRRSVLLSTGFMDERFMYGHNIDLHIVIRLAGFKTTTLPKRTSLTLSKRLINLAGIT